MRRVFIKMFLKTMWFKVALVLTLVDIVLWLIFVRMSCYKHPTVHGIICYIAISLPFWILWLIIMGIVEVAENLP
ncbi:MAG: hypothetical protein DRO13_04880 [Thermoprotei archaeon]|nr:MAG: hypothetical protein DRO13_04880 [Thermoprotei archaeon]